ncbi:DUF4935 domain-containing protein [Pseudomonas lurida]|uniref:PIN domain-containing protein n=1 Tax=Pseudomonas lurida TaxID=244566 RepID=UPI0015E3D8E6|nr:PIN domain-containing protein [Pseudomonas lurida]MBA1293753.1 DUF4935 domain-containing protein [Pseudomonas lurida]
MPLETRNVFIDTEFFVKANLDFNSTTIRAFEDLCQRLELNHITSTIVVKEVQRKIVSQIREALKGIKNFQRKAAVLKEYHDQNVQNLFTEIHEPDVEAMALRTFEGFITKSNATVLDMSGVDGNEIINMFFDHVTPFSSSKPNEFRDAFTLLSIRQHLKVDEKTYVVSSDPDHKAFCAANEKFISVDTLSAMLDIYNRHDKRAKFVEQFLESKRDEIRLNLQAQLNEAEAYNYSTWEDAEVDSFEVVEIGAFEPEIIKINDESCSIKFDMVVKFKVDASGPDFENSYYDREDDRLYTFDSIEREEEQEKEFSVEMDLFFEDDGGELINEEYDLDIKGLHGGIEFSVDEIPFEDPRM